MKGLLAYSGIITKVKAMQSHFITKDEFQEIVSLPDVASVTAWLKKRPEYADVLAEIDENNVHREILEYAITDTLLRDYEKIYSFSGPELRTFLSHYARRYELRVMKNILNRIFNEGAKSVDIPGSYRHYFNSYSSIDVEKLHAAKSTGEFIEALKGTPYYDPMKQVQNRNAEATLFDYETALDLFHFSSIWNDRREIAGKGENYDVLTDFYGTKFDLLNLWYIYRARTYYDLDKVAIYALTIPKLYRLKKDDIRSLVEAENDEAFEKALSATYYGRTNKDLKPDNLQYMYTSLCRKEVIRGTKEHPYSIATLYCYLYLKEHECYKLTTALECVRYGMDPIESMHYVTLR